MNRKILTSLLIIAMAAAAIGGGTLAWFTDSATITPNEFQAGTLKIRADETWAYEGGRLENWNPGDCTDKKVEVEVTGTKRAFLRMKVTETWQLVGGSPVVYTGRNAPNITWKVDGNTWPDGKWQMIEDTTTGIKWWYYQGILDPDQTRTPPSGPKKITVISKVCLDTSTGNDYQGATYTLAMDFEAIQTTNGAETSAWGVTYNATTKTWSKP